MAGNEGMSKGMTMSSAATDEACHLGVKKAGQLEYDAEPIRDMVNMSDYSLSEQLDLEMSKIEEMIRCLEQMERQFEQQRNSKQTVVKSVRDIDIIQYQASEAMERSKKSGIPIPKRVTPKLEQPLSPPLFPKNEEKEENCDKDRSTSDQPSDSPRTYMFIMDYFERQNFGQLYGGNFRPSWLPRRHYQPDHPPVLVVQVPVPVTWRNNCFAHDNLKSKSRAQRLRDFKRRQTFQEKKSICTMMPFYGLEEQGLTNEIRSGSEDQGSKFSSKLRKATKTVKILEIENQALLSSKAELGASIVEEKQRCQELSTQLEAALKTVENLTSYKQDYFDAEVRWSNELEKVQCLEQKVQQQAKMLEDYHDAEMRWSAENEKIQFLEQQVRQMWDNVMKPDSRQAVGPTCPYDSTDCSGPVTRNIPNTIAACNQETPVISSIFPVNSTTSKHKRLRKGRKK